MTDGVRKTSSLICIPNSKAGRDQQAIESYKQAIALKPDLAEAHNNLAILYLKRGDQWLALSEYKDLKSIDSEMAQKLSAAIYRDKILDAKAR